MNQTNCEFYGFSLGFLLKHLLVGTGFQPERLLIAIAYAIAIVFRNVVFVLRVLFLLKPET